MMQEKAKEQEECIEKLKKDIAKMEMTMHETEEKNSNLENTVSEMGEKLLQSQCLNENLEKKLNDSAHALQQLQEQRKTMEETHIQLNMQIQTSSVQLSQWKKEKELFQEKVEEWFDFILTKIPDSEASKYHQKESFKWDGEAMSKSLHMITKEIHHAFRYQEHLLCGERLQSGKLASKLEEVKQEKDHISKVLKEKQLKMDALIQSLQEVKEGHRELQIQSERLKQALDQSKDHWQQKWQHEHNQLESKTKELIQAEEALKQLQDQEKSWSNTLSELQSKVEHWKQEHQQVHQCLSQAQQTWEQHQSQEQQQIQLERQQWEQQRESLVLQLKEVEQQMLLLRAQVPHDALARVESRHNKEDISSTVYNSGWLNSLPTSSMSTSFLVPRSFLPDTKTLLFDESSKWERSTLLKEGMESTLPSSSSSIQGSKTIRELLAEQKRNYFPLKSAIS